MSISDKIRSCDSFGANFSLSYNGQTTYTTLGGGVVTICLRAIILTYFCLKMIALVGYKDFDINNYVIMEERQNMDKAFKFSDYNIEFNFGFMNDEF